MTHNLEYSILIDKVVSYTFDGGNIRQPLPIKVKGILKSEGISHFHLDFVLERHPSSEYYSFKGEQDYAKWSISNLNILDYSKEQFMEFIRDSHSSSEPALNSSFLYNEGDKIEFSYWFP